MFVAGDPSGDEHAAAVIRGLQRALPGTHTFGIGGPCMAAQGFEALLPFEPFNRMGFAEVVSHLPFFLSAKSRCVKELTLRRPQALVCVDYPGFNIPLMKAARRLSVPVVWYIVPQVWAWKKKRAAILGANASHIAVVFPFEVDYFRPFTAPVSFVGHPLVEMLDETRLSERRVPKQFPQSAASVTLALVPGSRRQEILRMLPAMIDAAISLKTRFNGLTVKLSACRGLARELFLPSVARFESLFPGALETSNEPLAQLVSKCDCAIVTSGTATLQTALCGVPLVIAYRTSALTFSLMKSMVRVPFIGLPNIVAGKKIVPECIQDDATGERLAQETARFLESKELYQTTVLSLSSLLGKLGEKKPSLEVASIVCDVAARAGRAERE